MKRLVAVTAFCAWWAVIPAAQAPAFRSGTESVRLDAAVSRQGRSVSGLGDSDFEVRDNGIVQKVRVIAAGTLPVDAVLVLDASASVAGEPLRWLQAAASAFCAEMEPEDRAAVLSFSHVVRLLVPLTRDHDAIRDATRRVSPEGATALHDALLAGVDLASAGEGRPFVLLLSDGADNFSWTSLPRLRDALRLHDAVVYVVSVRPPRLREAVSWERVDLEKVRPPDLSRSEKDLQALARETGGELLLAGWDSTLSRAFADALNRFRNRYVLAYTPSSAAPGWHRVSVKVKGGGLVRVRAGYRR